MKLFIYITLIIISAIFSVGLSQSNFIIHGVITNNEGDKIPDVKLFLTSNSKQVFISNKNGEYFIKVQSKITTEIVFDHVAYNQKIIKLTKKTWRKKVKDTLYLNIQLKYPQLPEIVIGGKQKPKVIFGSETSSIADFEFHEDKLVLLSYQKSLTKTPLIKLVDYNQKLISEYQAPKNALRLFKDYEGKLYLITKDKTYLISIVKNEIRLRPVEQELFLKFTSKIIDTLSNNFIYSNYSDNYPAFNYYNQGKHDTSSHIIHHVENNFMMDLYRSEFKYVSTKEKLWAFRQELKTGIDKEVWVGATSFTNSLYYEPLYAPLFVKDDTILIFDHYGDKLIKVNNEFKKIDSVGIVYHKSKKGKNWEQPLLKDKEEQKVYALFKRGGYYYLKNINLINGKTKTAFKLFYRFVEQPKVKDGYVYYIYRPFESTQRKFLYRELIAN